MTVRSHNSAESGWCSRQRTGTSIWPFIPRRAGRLAVLPYAQVGCAHLLHSLTRPLLPLLRHQAAPKTVDHIKRCAELGLYTSNHIFRVDRGFVAQVDGIENGRTAPMNAMQRVSVAGLGAPMGWPVAAAVGGTWRLSIHAFGALIYSMAAGCLANAAPAPCRRLLHRKWRGARCPWRCTTACGTTSAASCPWLATMVRCGGADRAGWPAVQQGRQPSAKPAVGWRPSRQQHAHVPSCWPARSAPTAAVPCPSLYPCLQIPTAAAAPSPCCWAPRPTWTSSTPFLAR